MSKGVTGPLLITAVVVAVGNGWILSAWTGIYNMTHGGAGAPVSAPTTRTGDIVNTAGNAGRPAVGGHG